MLPGVYNVGNRVYKKFLISHLKSLETLWMRKLEIRKIKMCNPLAQFNGGLG